eukprot:g1710.t1
MAIVGLITQDVLFGEYGQRFAQLSWDKNFFPPDQGDYADLFRELRGDLANKEPSSLKPPYRVASAKWPSSTRSPSPVGVLRMKIRMPGDRFPIDAVVQGEYMKWSIVEALMQSFKKLKIQINTGSILMCTDEIKILEVHTPSMAGNLWQFCEFRFDYQVAVEEEAALALVSGVFNRMADFEASFCQSLENKFREIYHLTVLGLINKRFALMDGRAVWNQLQFFKAAEVNDTNEITRLLKEAECIKVLLQANGDLNLKTRSGVAPVHLAAISNQSASLEVLKQCRANLDMPAVGGNTPVHEGVMQNNPEIIQKLFDLKADINIESGPDNHFATPLAMALERKKKKAAKKLQELNALEKVPGGNLPDSLEIVEFKLRRRSLR